MKLCRFDEDRVGIVRGEEVLDITGRLGVPASEFRVPDLGPWLEQCRRQKLSETRLLSPVKMPGKVLAAPVNYKAHIEEMKKANLSPGHDIWDIEKSGLFLKASSSVVGPSEGIALRFPERRTDFEVELVAIIGTQASQVKRKDALKHVAGYCLGLDITLRGSEDRSFRKSIDSYTVLGPWLTTKDEVPDPQHLRLALWQNDTLRQNTGTSDMLWPLDQLIEFASRFYTLQPGDAIFTGTPSGIGPIRPGDKLRAESDLLGSMEVSVRRYK
jgi:2-keto-4-pentenoate hydratase/2-oxohepta-3-ene-1,7-dioic acid hydratase in catechol pathway